MNDKQIKNIELLKEAARQKFNGGRFSEHFGNDATLVAQVRDPVYCRTFELETFYEFDEAKNIDSENVDMTLQLLVLNRHKEVIYTLLAIRVASHPAVNSIFDVINPFIVKDITEEALVVLNDLLQSLSATQVIVAGLLAAHNNLENFKNDKYTVIAVHRSPVTGETLNLLHKSY